jgi:hypothetical protein
MRIIRHLIGSEGLPRTYSESEQRPGREECEAPLQCHVKGVNTYTNIKVILHG